VVEGSALLLVGSEEVALRTGDLAVLPHGSAHTLADARAVDVPALEERLADYGSGDGTGLRYGGTGARTRLVCGGFSLADGIPESTLARFPRVLHLPRDAALAPLLESVRAETEAGEPGAEAVVAKLADVFLRVGGRRARSRSALRSRSPRSSWGAGWSTRTRSGSCVRASGS